MQFINICTTFATREESVFNQQLGEHKVLISWMTLDFIYPTEEMYINYKHNRQNSD